MVALVIIVLRITVRGVAGSDGHGSGGCSSDRCDSKRRLRYCGL